MKERPIIFSGPMVRAILDNRKHVTRRIVKLPDNAVDVIYYAPPSGRSQTGWADPGVRYLVPDPEDSLPPGFPDEIEPWPHSLYIHPCPYGQPGDRLYVREAARIDYVGENFKDADKSGWSVTYRADGRSIMHRGLMPGRWFPDQGHCTDGRIRWAPSIHMPKWAARIWLEVAGVRVERLQDITQADAIAEGIAPAANSQTIDCDTPNPVDRFRGLWDSLNAKRAPWDSSPWVWVIEFQKLRTGDAE